jgi:hypothetical protein
MRGQEFLNIARSLESISGEAADRTRIGRLYYGVYLEYRQYCEDALGFRRERMAREHQAVYSLISQIDVFLAADLRELRHARNQADYDLDVIPTDIADRVIDAQRLARHLMRRLAELRDDA